MNTTPSTFDRINDCTAVRIRLASPQAIRSWSCGEVKTPETLDFRTGRPLRDGLFCERIFGPLIDWTCARGKHHAVNCQGTSCDECGVPIAPSSVRRRRMGHIELAAPVVHVWFLRLLPSKLGALLDMTTRSLQRIVYFQDYVVVDPGATPLKKGQLLTEEDYHQARSQFGDAFDADMGAAAIRQLLQRLDLVELSRQLRADLAAARQQTRPSPQKQNDLRKRLQVVEALRDSGNGGPPNQPEWMVLECLPVIPPELRPLVLLDNGNFLSSDLNQLYQRILNRNNRLKKLIDLKAPEVIVRNEKRMLQQTVDALFDNRCCKRPVRGFRDRPLQSLGDQVRSGRANAWRVNRVGKRVDFSGRSVLVPGPELLLHQCGLPKTMALELFQPFVLGRLKTLGHADTLEAARQLLERRSGLVWDVLAQAVRGHPVLLCRAPALNRMCVQAFEPVLIEGKAIRIHPLLCRNFRAHFAGEQVTIHLPLSTDAQADAALLMAADNLFSPVNGRLLLAPSADIVLGCAHLTVDPWELCDRPFPEEDVRPPDLPPNLRGAGMIFTGPEEVHQAFAAGKVGVHARIRVRLPRERRVLIEDRGSRIGGLPSSILKPRSSILDPQAWEEVPRDPSGLVSTTVGRVLFNDVLRPSLAFYDVALSAQQLARIIADSYRELGRAETIQLLDRIKEVGFRELTRCGLSLSIADLKTPANKEAVLRQTEMEVAKIQRMCERNVITDHERYNKVIDLWSKARDQITTQTTSDLRHDGAPGVNPIYLMACTGARGGVEQIRQLVGMPSLRADRYGRIFEMPIKANFREGLSVLEYFQLARGNRTTRLSAAAQKFVDPAYWIRKLVNVAGNVIVTRHDCGTTQGITKDVLFKGDVRERPLSEAIRGRVSCRTLATATGAVIARANEMISAEAARRLEALGIDKLRVRSPLTCDAPRGVCQLCYGADLATGRLVEVGTAAGMIAAQSLGEPIGTLDTRIFNIGGFSVGMGRLVDKEYKTRKGGEVRLERLTVLTNTTNQAIALGQGGRIVVLGHRGQRVEEFPVPHGALLKVAHGQWVPPGQLLCEWDPSRVPILAEHRGIVRFKEIVEGETLQTVREPVSARAQQVIREHNGDLHPQILVEDAQGKVLEGHYLPEQAVLAVQKGNLVSPGHLLATVPRAVGGVRDVVGGWRRWLELLEARRPQGAAVLAEVAGRVRVSASGQGQDVVWVQPVDHRGVALAPEAKHWAPRGKSLRVGSGDHVRAGDPLVHGPPSPHDLLRILGVAAVQHYLVREVQEVYRCQGVVVDDRHIEIVVARMLRQVQVEDPGDTALLPGTLMDWSLFRETNRPLQECVRVVQAGDATFAAGQLVPRATFAAVGKLLKQQGKRPPYGVPPKPASCRRVLLGITAAAQPDSFLAAASLQEPARVLTEAALAGQVDPLLGLRENVILGRLIPAGTGSPRSG